MRDYGLGYLHVDRVDNDHGSVVTHRYFCSAACAPAVATPLVYRPATTKRCAGCGRSLFGGPRRSDATHA